MIRRLVAKPEFGPLVLLLAELLVFWSINHDFLSPLNISNTLAFTVELGLIALAMTLLMTSGEFDLSVGSLFGFTPVLMWTLFNSGVDVAASRLRHRLDRRRPDRPGERPVRDPAEDSVLPGHARHAAGGARHGPVRHRRLSAAHLDRRRSLARPAAGRRFLYRAVPHLHVAVLVHRGRDHPRLRPDARPSSATGSRRPAAMPMRRGPAASMSSVPRSCCSCCPP